MNIKEIEQKVAELDEHTTIEMELIRELDNRMEKVEKLILSMMELMKNCEVEDHYLKEEEL